MNILLGILMGIAFVLCLASAQKDINADIAREK